MGFPNIIKAALGELLNLVYPRLCVICEEKLRDSDTEKERTYLCEKCLRKIKRNLPPYCVKCGRSMQGAVQSVAICWECSGRNFWYERTWSGFLYEGLLKEALHLFKYSKRFYLSSLFCNLLIQFLKEHPEISSGIDAAVAVPLHSVRFREREFNQAHILAAALVKEFAIKDISRCLRRTVSTRPQSELDKKERFDNIRGAFEVVDGNLVRGRELLIIDDLFTTGATLNECAKALKKAGSGKIRCLTVARGV